MVNVFFNVTLCICSCNFYGHSIDWPPDVTQQKGNLISYMLYVAKIELSKQHSVNKEITSELNNSKTEV